MLVSKNNEYMNLEYKDFKINFMIENETFYIQNLDLVFILNCEDSSNLTYLIGGDTYLCSCNTFCKEGNVCPCVSMTPSQNVYIISKIDGIVKILFDASKTRVLE
jgi:hypothetical protein